MSRSRGSTQLAVALVALLLVTACGSRRSYEDLLAVQQGSAGSVERGSSSRNVGPAPGGTGNASSTDVTGGNESAGNPNSTGTGDTRAPQADGEAMPAGQSCTGTEPPLVIASVGTQSGIIGSIIGDAAKVVSAWAASINARGGLNCHRVEHLIADDGGDPSRHLALVREMVERRGVQAFIQMNGVISGQGAAGYLAERGIPVIGGDNGSEWFYDHPNFFPATATGRAALEYTFAGAATVATNQGLSRVGVFNCIEATICSEAGTLAPSYAARYGVSLVYQGDGSIAQPDYTSACQNAKNAGVEVLAVYMDVNSVQRLNRSCRSVGFRPVVVASGLGVGPQLLDDPNSDGVYGAMGTIPWVETSNPEVAAAVETVRQYAPGIALSTSTMHGWASARLLETAVAGVGELNSATILDALSRVSGTNLGGITNEIQFAPGATAARNFCVWLVQVSDGEFRGTGTEPTRCGVNG